MLTKDAFSKWFQDEVLGRWAQCAFTAQQVADWHWRLKRFEAGVLTEAVRRHCTRDEPRRPSLKKIYEYAHASVSMTSDSKKRDGKGVPDAHTYIQCVGKDDNGRGTVGRFVPILLWPFHKTYTRQMFDTAAENQRRLHQQNSGGAWEIVTGTNYSQMQQRQWALTGQTERVEANAEKIRRLLNANRQADKT